MVARKSILNQTFIHPDGNLLPPELEVWLQSCDFEEQKVEHQEDREKGRVNVAKLVEEFTVKPKKTRTPLLRQRRPSAKIIQAGQAMEKEIIQGIHCLNKHGDTSGFPDWALLKKDDPHYKKVLEEHLA